jgi:hypothetical protein
MESKIHSTIVITSILAFALIATAGISITSFVNVLAQESSITPEGSINDTMSGQNASQWASNATLAFAQEGFQTEDLVNETIDLGNNTGTSNATLAYAQGEDEDDTGMTEGLGNYTGITGGQTDGKGNMDTGNDGGGE